MFSFARVSPLTLSKYEPIPDHSIIKDAGPIYFIYCASEETLECGWCWGIFIFFLLLKQNYYFEDYFNC